MTKELVGSKRLLDSSVRQKNEIKKIPDTREIGRSIFADRREGSFSDRGGLFYSADRMEAIILGLSKFLLKAA
jgi:hypothetical protein